VSSGVSAVTAKGYGVVEISSPEPLASYSAFGVTVKPAGVSQGPARDKVFAGRLQNRLETARKRFLAPVAGEGGQA